jgi:hypothetical protein
MPSGLTKWGLKMQIYQNLNGDSGVAAFEIGSDFIVVRFKEGQFKNYTYTYASAGQAAVESLKALALGGKGLNSFIGRHVKKAYAQKNA